MKGIFIQAFLCLWLSYVRPNVGVKNENTLVKANRQFAVDIYKKIADENPDKNLFLSPLSIFIAFGMMNLGSRGQTMSQLREVLHLNKLNSDDAINDGFKQIITKLNSSANDYTLHLVNRLFGSKEFQVKDRFLRDADAHFKALLEPLDFSQQTEQSRLHINQFVENQTNGKIKDLLPSGSVDSQTVLISVNAMYFQAGWYYQFSKSRTKPAPFHISKDEEVQMDQMSMITRNLGYYESEYLNCSIAELPCLDNRVSMFVFLPREIDGLANLEKRLTRGSLIHALHMTQDSDKELLDVSMPKFEMDQIISLKKFLQSLGMVDLFERGRCNVSDISDDPRLFVSDAVHKTYIKVDEFGSEAAKPTYRGFYMGWGKPFTVDRPYLFVIFEKSTKSILFLGRIVRPPKSNDIIGKFETTSALKADGATAIRSTIANIAAAFLVLNLFIYAGLSL